MHSLLILPQQFKLPFCLFNPFTFPLYHLSESGYSVKFAFIPYCRIHRSYILLAAKLLFFVGISKCFLGNLQSPSYLSTSARR